MEVVCWNINYYRTTISWFTSVFIDWLLGFLNTLGGAYAACALFNIGIFMVGKMKKITMNLLLVASLLIFAKT